MRMQSNRVENDEQNDGEKNAATAQFATLQKMC